MFITVYQITHSILARCCCCLVQSLLSLSKKVHGFNTVLRTLALWAMFSLTFPLFADTSMFAVQSSHNPVALWIVSGLALASNIAVFVYHFGRIYKRKYNPLKDEVYTDLKAYQEIVTENK